jgi:hypothetical protein
MKHHHKLGKCDNQHTVWLIVWKFWRDGILAPCQEHANQEARQALSSSNERASEYWVRSVYAVRPPRDHQVHTNQRRSATGLHARRGRESEIEGNIRRAPCTPPFTGELKLPAGHRVAVDHIHRFVYPAGLSLSLSPAASPRHTYTYGERRYPTENDGDLHTRIIRSFFLFLLRIWWTANRHDDGTLVVENVILLVYNAWTRLHNNKILVFMEMD